MTGDRISVITTKIGTCALHTFRYFVLTLLRFEAPFCELLSLCFDAHLKAQLRKLLRKGLIF